MNRPGTHFVRLRAPAALLGLALAVAPAGSRGEERLRLNGSGSCLDLMKPLLEAYQATGAKLQAEIGPPLGSSGAVAALLDGALDLAVIGRTASPEEIGRGATALAYGRTPLLLVTHPGVSVRDLPLGELEALYAGRQPAWPDGTPVRVVLRPTSETNTALLARLSPGMAAADAEARRQPWALVAVTDPEASELVARTPGALGAATLSSLLVGRPPLHPVALGGVEGSVEALRLGRYPLAKGIVFVTTARSAPVALAVVAFACSPAGRAVAAASGVLVEGCREAAR